MVARLDALKRLVEAGETFDLVVVDLRWCGLAHLPTVVSQVRAVQGPAKLVVLLDRPDDLRLVVHAGVEPDLALSKTLPTMTLRSRLIATQQLQAGDTVGYGSSFTAPGPMRIGIVACGYADGYPRHCPTGTPVLVDGVRTRTLGRVSMDMIAVDLTPCDAAGHGSSQGQRDA